jgi:hypothetical protein
MSDKHADLEWEVIPAESKPVDKRLAKMERHYIRLPFTMYILGSCGSGKSSILWSLLTKAFVYGKKKKSVFDECAIYLGTLDARESFEKLPIEYKAIMDEYDPVAFEEYMDDLRKSQMELLEQGKPCENILAIWDDFVGEGLTKKSKANRAPPVQRIALTSRHEHNMSLVFCSQVYKKSGFSEPAVRNNITTFVVSRMSRPELLKIAEELAGDYDVDEWLEIYDTVMAKQPYNFVVLDRRRPLGAQWTERFNVPFPPPRRLAALKTKSSLDTKDTPDADKA